MESASFAFTSGQAEAMCKAKPPSLAVRAEMELPHAPVAKLARVRDGLHKPQLNFGDIPEASLPAARQHAQRVGARQVPGRHRVKTISLPLFQEDIDDEEQEREVVQSEEVEDKTWSCAACTFLNSGLLDYCEVCQLERGAVPKDMTIQLSTSQALLSAVPEDSWPSLEDSAESWVNCDISSVASSWLDVGCAEACIEEDGEESGTGALLVSAAAAQAATAPATLSWAARVGALGGPPPVAPAQGRRMAGSPLVCRAPVARRGQQAEEEGEDLDLLELLDRRLYPQTTRGATMRRRAKR